ncbi:hypothetical protein DBR06_SOUSAS20210009 [Sousa chinensis]|uniref:Uncharacterized protein n=1 Tax=Sousa chinensis TaxID=103600 RepID=A0A484GGE8_SOUCH|nr:hypothetical protein DBR06_SOUSAS20210009 [Sousa chinensis]
MEALLAKLNRGLSVPLRSFTLWTQEVSLPSKMCPGHHCETYPVYTRTPALSSSPSPGARPPLSRASPFLDTEAHVMDNRELEFVTLATRHLGIDSCTVLQNYYLEVDCYTRRFLLVEVCPLASCLKEQFGLIFSISASFHQETMEGCMLVCHLKLSTWCPIKQRLCEKVSKTM